MPDELDSEVEDVSVPAKKGFPFKMVLIGLIVAVAAGGGALYFLRSGKGGAAPAETRKKAGSSYQFVPLQPFIMNLADPGRYLKMTLQLQVQSAGYGQLVAEDTPEIRDAIITLLGSKTVDDLTSADGKMQLKDDIILRVNQAMGKPAVKNVFFTEFVMQ